jgi:DNA adenine methylase
MKYMGSKNRIAKYILPIVLQNRTSGQWYVEPFVGGANLIDKAEGNRIGADINYYLIELLKALQGGWIPPKIISEGLYKCIKNNKEIFKPEVVGFAGFGLSFGAMWFGSYRRDSVGERNYPLEAFNNAIKQSPNLKNIIFKNCSYLDLEIPPTSIIYCDPPYQDTTKYTANKKELDYPKFWQWCRDKGDEGHEVYISSYEAPNDFEVLWEKEINSSLTKNTGAKKGLEKLFLAPPLSIL